MVSPSSLQEIWSENNITDFYLSSWRQVDIPCPILLCLNSWHIANINTTCDWHGVVVLVHYLYRSRLVAFVNHFHRDWLTRWVHNIHVLSCHLDIPFKLI